jgi:PAS domain S-box-containing protein
MEQPHDPESLREALAFAHSIIDTVREALIVLDGGLRVVSASRSFYRAFEATPEQTEGRPIFELGNGQWDIPDLRRLLGEILPGNDSFDDFEVELDFPNIGPRSMRLNARRVFRETARQELILLAIEDITELRRAQRERERVEVNFTSLVQNIRDHSIFTLDPAGRINSWNEAATQILGYTEEEALGQPFALIFTDEDRVLGLPEEELREARETGRREDERWHARKGGEHFWAFGIVTPMHDAGGRLVGYSKVLRDITERKRMEEALLEADRRKDEFLATLAHELRNPLAPLLSVLQLMGSSGGAGEEFEAERAMAERQVRYMTRLIDDLMDLSRISRGKLRLRVEPLEMCEMVRRAVESARSAIEVRGHALHLSIPEPPIVLEADPTRLEQMVWNLLSNAAKYTEPGGRIDLTVERADAEAVLRVRDTGIGIEPDLLPRIFEPFVQAESGSGRSQGGLGIGLGLVRSLVELHGGTIEGHSEGLGTGSEFVVRLPVRPPGGAIPGSERGREAAEAGPLPRRRILVVDDNVDAAKILARLLESNLGQEVRVVHNGPGALHAAAEFRPEVILLDLGLPGIDGCEVARRLRGRPETSGTVLIALTGWGQEQDRRRTVEAGIDRHLVKPVDIDEIEGLLRDLGTTQE